MNNLSKHLYSLTRLPVSTCYAGSSYHWRQYSNIKCNVSSNSRQVDHKNHIQRLRRQKKTKHFFKSSILFTKTILRFQLCLLFENYNRILLSWRHLNFNFVTASHWHNTFEITDDSSSQLYYNSDCEICLHSKIIRISRGLFLIIDLLNYSDSWFQEIIF